TGRLGEEGASQDPVHGAASRLSPTHAPSVRFLVPDGYEVYGYVVMVVVGAAVGAAGGALDERSRG
ncbi:hypothetical protein ACFXCO_40855, partial [Streptomyces hygroscopicus]